MATIPTAPMWRVKYVEGNSYGGGGGGDWAYYEAKDYERMEGELLEALLNGDCGDGGTTSSGNRLSKILRRHRNTEVADEGAKWRRYRVVEVAYLDGDEWVPVKVTWEPPTVRIEA